MKRTDFLFFSFFIFLIFLTGCAEHDGIVGLDALQTSIRISSAYPSVMQTRATIDGGFVAGDEMGVFVVDYTPSDSPEGEGWQPGTMAVQGNRASNIRFTLQEDGSWTAPVQLYWDVKGAAADFYGYYPFDGDLSSVTAYRFAVESNQDTEASNAKLAGYTASDFLWAKQEHVSPTTETVTLQYRHLMAGVIIRLERGTGFTAEEWAALEKTVFLKNTVLDGTVDLSTATVTPTGTSTGVITPLSRQGADYRAIVFPQTVAARKELIQIYIDGKAYGLTKTETMNFLSGKMHQFTVTIDRSTTTGDYVCTLADEAIVPWVDDADVHEGLVHQYVFVEVEEPGTLGTKLLQQVADITKVKNLKVTGTINGDDLSFIWNEVISIQRLNLLKAVIEDGVLKGPSIGQDIPRHHPLESIIYPEIGLKEIHGFIGTSLHGSLIIPEGVEVLGWHAFSNNPLTGTLSLPSTLKYTDVLCEYNNTLHGEFRMPESMVEWGGVGGDYTGTMYLPPSMKKINGLLPPGLTGTINIPQGCELNSEYGGEFRGSQCTSLVLPEGMTTISNACFVDAEIRGEIRIPSTVTKIRDCAFLNTKISHVILPENLKEIEERAFEGCSRLSGTLKIPKKMVRINRNTFYGCEMLTGIVFHKDVAVIDQYAFAGCYNLNSIVCEGEEPPVVVDEAFIGVPKDNFTVEVPKGCVEKYRNARGWSDFKRIAEYSNFVCRPATACALNNRHQEQLVLNADGAWTVISKPEWLALSSSNGTGKTPITATFQPLNHGAGHRTGEVVFEMTTGGKTVTTSCKLSQYDYEYEEDSYLTLQKATKGQRGGIDIVFVGDGYDGSSISDGSYLDLVRYQTECFFGIEPYRSMRDYFNVYVTFPLSQERGVNTMYTYVNNRFGTLQGVSSLLDGAQRDFTSSQLIMETDEVRDYVVEKTPVKEDNLWRTLVIAVPNSTDYEGNTVYCNGGPSIAICPPSEQSYPRDTRGTIQHEAGGHAFAYLGDETIVKNAFASPNVKQQVEELHRYGWYQNLATTGKLHDVPWAEFIFDPEYSDRVDVYEGGYGYTRGIYRPEANSCMNYGIPYYNTPSRLAIYQRIKDYAGEEFRMEDFRAQDTFEWGPTVVGDLQSLTRSAATDMKNLTPITEGNHREPTIVNFREVGDKVRAIRRKVKVKSEEWRVKSEE